MEFSWGIFFLIIVICIQIILLFCLCTGRITIFTFIDPSRTINNNTRNNMNRSVIINQEIKQKPQEEIEINPPNVFIIKHPNNEISVGIKHEIT